MTSLVLVTINGGERPRTAAFGSGPRLVRGSRNGLRPLPSASFKEGACSSVNNKKTVALASAGIGLLFRAKKYNVPLKCKVNRKLGNGFGMF